MGDPPKKIPGLGNFGAGFSAFGGMSSNPRLNRGMAGIPNQGGVTTVNVSGGPVGGGGKGWQQGGWMPPAPSPGMGNNALPPVPPGKIEGIVTKWCVDESYGFIRPTNPPATEDVWCGRSGIGPNVERLTEGEICYFTTAPSEKKAGMCAVQVSGPAVVEGDGCLALNTTMPQPGVVTKWDAERSFGFITPVAGGAGVFVRRDGLGKDAMLIEGLACWFEIMESIGSKARGKWQAKNVSGPAVLHRAEHFKPGELVVYREGTDCKEKDEKGVDGAWYLQKGFAATVVRVVGDGLVLDNGKLNSAPLHAAYWWRKNFLKIDIGGPDGVNPVEDTMEKTLQLSVANSMLITKIQPGGQGEKAGLACGQVIRWVAGQDVYMDLDIKDIWKAAKDTGESFEVLVLLPCGIEGSSRGAHAVAAAQLSALAAANKPNTRPGATNPTSRGGAPASSLAAARQAREAAAPARATIADRTDRDRRRRTPSRDRRRRSRDRDRRRDRSRSRRRRGSSDDGKALAIKDKDKKAKDDSKDGSRSHKKSKKSRRRRRSSSSSS
eukprot:TRINITY_DN3235_c5_g1_i1.p1 TRINITY_DN3235_c5_g1~~TRINITY_DN3235_c5_g1_i1.p1  ORF type:complete len:585 (+),score=191.73 TRINITY_DN3235_c5_g1_i1:108-1757(+)